MSHCVSRAYNQIKLRWAGEGRMVVMDMLVVDAAVEKLIVEMR